MITSISAPNLAVDAPDGIRYAYRRFGNTAADVPPLLLLQRFRGNLDDWDPALLDPLAERREVITVDYPGVGGSSGAPRADITRTAEGISAFVAALGLATIDLLGYSLGGFVAQELTLAKPALIRKLVLAGTAPEGGEDIQDLTPPVLAAATDPVPKAENLVYLNYDPSETSRAAGFAHVQRIYARAEDRDRPTDGATLDAQLTAFRKWGGAASSRLDRLTAITQPVLVANGVRDILLPTKNTYLIGERIPNAKVIVYPDSGHGFLYQYADEFSTEVNAFLA
jgi:pimeloyl-ACP methyl ester carboxylesterase